MSFTLLSGVESLLSAKVADRMTGRKHRYNMEVVAQGIANMVSALFGGISVTGTIARTATNIRAGARSPFSGMMHAGFILIFMLALAPLAKFIRSRPWRAFLSSSVGTWRKNANSCDCSAAGAARWY
jgi:SulP family sulfate permease